MTITYIEFTTRGNQPDKRKDNRFFGKKKSDATKQAERLDARYNSRRNTCDVCFVVKSANGNCDCD